MRAVANVVTAAATVAAAAAGVAAAAGTGVDGAAAAAAGPADRERAAGRADGEAGNASAHDDADLLEVNAAERAADRARRVHCSQIYPVVRAAVLPSPAAAAVSRAAVRRLPDSPASC